MEEEEEEEELGDLFSRKEESNNHLAKLGLMFEYLLPLHGVLLS